MKTTFVAAKDLIVDGKPVKQGDVLFTVESDHAVDRALAGVGNGAAITAEEYASRSAPKEPDVPAAPAPRPARPAKAPDKQQG